MRTRNLLPWMHPTASLGDSVLNVTSLILRLQRDRGTIPAVPYQGCSSALCCAERGAAKIEAVYFDQVSYETQPSSTSQSSDPGLRRTRVIAMIREIAIVSVNVIVIIIIVIVIVIDPSDSNRSWLLKRFHSQKHLNLVRPRKPNSYSSSCPGLDTQGSESRAFLNKFLWIFQSGGHDAMNPEPYLAKALV